MMWYALDWAALALAITWGRPAPWLACVVAANLAAGAWGGQMALAMFDLTAAALCFGRTRRGDVLAVVFLAAVFINLGGWAIGFAPSTTYAILGVVAWAEFGVLGGLDTGIGNGYRRLRAGMANPSQRASRPFVARNSAPDGGGRG